MDTIKEFLDKTRTLQRMSELIRLISSEREVIDALYKLLPEEQRSKAEASMGEYTRAVREAYCWV